MTKYANATKQVAERKNQKIHFDVFVAYTTAIGKQNLEGTGSQTFLPTLHAKHVIPTITEQPFTQEELVRLNKMFRGNPKDGTTTAPPEEDFTFLKQRANLFFGHKVPDDLSALEDFFRKGQIKCSSSKEPAQCGGRVVSFTCIPYITPPYYDTPGYSNEAGKCLSVKFANPECTKLKNARDALASENHKEQCNGEKFKTAAFRAKGKAHPPTQ
jgi:hypothetical protein